MEPKHCLQDYANISLYDPIFSTEDLELFEELRFQILPENRARSKAFRIRLSTLINQRILHIEWRIPITESDHMLYAPLRYGVIRQSPQGQ